MKKRVIGCVRGALESKRGRAGAFEGSLRACIRFYQQGKIRGEAELADYFRQELGESGQISGWDLLESSIVVGLFFGPEPAFEKTLSLCRIWGLEAESDDAVAYAMLSGVLAWLAEGEILKKSVNWALDKMLEGEDHERLIELMKLVVALHESGKPLSRSVAFLNEGNGFHEVFGAALLVALKAGDGSDALEPEDLEASVAITSGALIGAIDPLSAGTPLERIEIPAVRMAEDLYEIVYNDVILPFDKYAPGLKA